MAVAIPYVAPPLRRRGFVAFRQSLRGTTTTSYIALGAMVLLLLVAAFATLLAPHDPTLPAGTPLSPPGSGFLLGTDEIGRDVASRVLIGMRTSVIGALIVCLTGLLIGGIVGLIAGAVGGWVDALLMRITDIFNALPGQIMAVALVAALGPSLKNTLIGVSILWWTLYARIIRAEVRKVMTSPHVQAAKLSGIRPARVVVRHLMPGVIPAAIITTSLDISALVLTLAGLSFLGLGAPAPAPELGAMTARGMTYIFDYWWVPVMPALGVFIIAVVANFGGDAIRDLVRDR